MKNKEMFNKLLGGTLMGSAVIEGIIGIHTHEAVPMLIAAVLGVGGWKVWRANREQQPAQ